MICSFYISSAVDADVDFKMNSNEKITNYKKGSSVRVILYFLLVYIIMVSGLFSISL